MLRSPAPRGPCSGRAVRARWRHFAATTCILANCFSESWQKPLENACGAECTGALEDAEIASPPDLSKCSQALLPNCSQTRGVQALGDGLQLPQLQPEFGSSALEGTIKKHFALQLKSLIKICKHVNGKGKKGSVQSSPFPLASLVNFQNIPHGPSCSAGQPGVPPCLLVPGLTPPGVARPA